MVSGEDGGCDNIVACPFCVPDLEARATRVGQERLCEGARIKERRVRVAAGVGGGIAGLLFLNNLTMRAGRLAAGAGENCSVRRDDVEECRISDGILHPHTGQAAGQKKRKRWCFRKPCCHDILSFVHRACGFQSFCPLPN